MNVPSYQFLIFAAVAALLVNVSTAPLWRRSTLALANVAFVLTFTRDPAALAPFAGLLALGFAAVKLMEAKKPRLGFALIVAAMVLLFCWLKRYGFIPHALFLPYAYFAVGMSYVFFRVLHLIIDAYQDALPERVGPLAYVSYTLNFTALVSGPIQLFGDYRRTEIEAPAPLSGDAIARALERMIEGFFKVSVLSPLLYAAQQWCVATMQHAASVDARIACGTGAIVLFPVYLYVNFSGYTDFVIGTARFLRLELPENFDRPFAAEGFIDFWARWHMTLSGWLKRYVYTPLMMNLIRRYPSPKVEPYLGVGTYFVTFFLIGVWHGQTAMFLVYGVLQGLGVSVNKLYQIEMIRRLGRKGYRALCARPLYRSVSRGLTFTYFAVSMLWFWANADELRRYASTLGPAASVAAVAVSLVLATVVLAAFYGAEDGLRGVGLAESPVLRSAYARTAWGAALAAVVISVAVVLNAPAPQIVYKAF